MRILVSAYACEPGKGSEPAVGWNWVRQLARHHDVWVITRANNRDVIERAMQGPAEGRPAFLYTDLPSWARAWKRGQRGARVYSYLWQFAALRVALRAHREVRFDLVHHLTFATAVAPALVCLVPAPFVWGPVGGGVGMPWRFAGELGAAGVAYEILRSARRCVGRYLDPLVRITWIRADRILVQNRETLDWLPARHRHKAMVCPNAGFDPAEIVPRAARAHGSVLAVAAGRLLPTKGFSLAIRAFARARRGDLRLVVVGDGRDRTRLERLAGSLGVDSRVRFVGWQPQDALFELFSRAHVLLMPSLHEDCGFVVPEAMAHGAVPVVLHSGGPPQLVGDAGIVIEAGGPRQVVRDLAAALEGLYDEARSGASPGRAIEGARRWSWDSLDDTRLRHLGATGMAGPA
jgi:glycosyltransferase involved in cell wall biosynthesis